MSKNPRAKVIISCAITGSIHTPSMSPHLPVTSAEIARQAIDAAKAGAAILHLHARHDADGRPSSDPQRYREFLPQIKHSCDAVINLTTGGGLGMTVEQRMDAALQLRPELASLNMGSMNFGLYPALGRYTSFQHPWERGYLEMTRDFIFRNTFQDIETLLKRLGEEGGTRFEFECYDVGHLYNLAHFLDRGLLRPPLFVQTIFGILGGIGADADNVSHMRHIANKLFGDNYVWSLLAAGRHQMPLVTMGAIMGASVRVGLEDSLYLEKGRLAQSNAEQVTRMRGILENLSLTIATPAEARAMLGLKGGAHVAF